MTLIKSMTGYGRAVGNRNGPGIYCGATGSEQPIFGLHRQTARSLNFAEDGVKQRVKAAVARGKVDVFISAGAAAGDLVQVSLNRPVLEGYLQAMRTMVEDYGVRDDISAAALSRLPEVFLVEKPREDEDQLLSALLQVVDKALAAFDAMRRAEGAAMEADLRSRRQRILDLVAQVEVDSPQTVADYRARLEAKMQEVLERTAVDESRILQEAAIFADKVAVDEETVRLRSHLAQMETMLASGGAVGRKLDFLLQEMNRGGQYHWLQVHGPAAGPGGGVEIKGSWEKIRGANPEHRMR